MALSRGACQDMTSLYSPVARENSSSQQLDICYLEDVVTTPQCFAKCHGKQLTQILWKNMWGFENISPKPLGLGISCGDSRRPTRDATMMIIYEKSEINIAFPCNVEVADIILFLFYSQ